MFNKNYLKWNAAWITHSSLHVITKFKNEETIFSLIEVSAVHWLRHGQWSSFTWLSMAVGCGFESHKKSAIPSLVCVYICTYTYIQYVYIYGVGGGWVQLSKGQGGNARVIFVLHECIWNAPAVLLVLPAFDDTGSLGSPPCQVVYLPWFNGSTLGDWLTFPCGE